LETAPPHPCNYAQTNPIIAIVTQRQPFQTTPTKRQLTITARSIRDDRFL